MSAASSTVGGDMVGVGRSEFAVFAVALDLVDSTVGGGCGVATTGAGVAGADATLLRLSLTGVAANFLLRGAEAGVKVVLAAKEMLVR